MVRKRLIIVISRTKKEIKGTLICFTSCLSLAVNILLVRMKQINLPKAKDHLSTNGYLLVGERWKQEENLEEELGFLFCFC